MQINKFVFVPKIKELTFQEKEIYNQFVRNHSRGQLLQLWEWGEVKENFSWQAIRLGIFEKDKLVGTGQILFRILPFGFRMFYIPRGPLLNFEKNFDLFLEKIKELVKKKKVDFLRIEPEIFENELDFQFFKKRGFRKTKSFIQSPRTMITDLTKEDLFNSEIKPKARYNIKLAQKKGVKIRQGEGQKDIEEFIRLYQETAKRKKFFLHSEKYFKKVLSILVPRFVCLILAFYKNKLIAGAAASIFGRKAIYLYAAMDYQYHKLMPSYLVLWQAISKAKQAGCQYFDLWGVVPEKAKKNHPWQGITIFKQRFCRGKVKNYLGCLDLSFTWKYWLFLILEKARKLILGFRS